MVPSCEEVGALLPEPQLAYGLFVRLLGCVYCISFASLSLQIVAMAGSEGIAPAQKVVEQLATDFPSALRRFWYFPSVFHALRPTDWALRSACAGGFCCGLAMAYGGSVGAAAAPLAWGVMVSLDLVADLNYPWDCLLLEAGFLALLLPRTAPLPGLGAVGLPTPAVAFALRWLLFRVLFGFGKLKFLGTSAESSCYIKAFLIGMPIPTRSAWYAHRAPLPLHQLALLVMFLIEIPLPFGVFVPGLPRLAAAAGIAALQLGIALTGNFGHFNVLTVVLCLPLLDNPCGVPTPEPPGAVDSALWYFFALFGGVSLVFNSWCARSWAFWPALSQHPNPAVAAIAEAFRVVCSWRLVHAYGVFPPHSSPPARFVPVFEGSADGGKTWLRYRYRYMTSAVDHAPCHVAPFHPRWDHAVFYEGFGLNAHNFASSLNVAQPYRLSRSTPLHRLAQRLLESPDGCRPVETTIFGSQGNPFHNTSERPNRVRVSLYMFTPNDGADKRAADGAWWSERRIGTQLPATKLDPTVWEEWLPPRSELWHPDVGLGLRPRAAAAGNPTALTTAALVSQPRAPAAALIADPPTGPSLAISESAVESFFSELLPSWTELVRKTASSRRAAGTSAGGDDWESALMVGWQRGVPVYPASPLASRHGAKRMREWEAVAGRLTTLLFDRYVPNLRAAHAAAKAGTEPNLPQQDGTRGLVVEHGSYFQLWLSCQVAVLRGRLIWAGCWEGAGRGEGSAEAPSSFARMQMCANASTAEKLGLLALFWPATLAFHASKARLSARIIAADNAPSPDADGLVPGFVHLGPYLATQFLPSAQEQEDLPELGFPPAWGDWDMAPKRKTG